MEGGARFAGLWCTLLACLALVVSGCVRQDERQDDASDEIRIGFLLDKPTPFARTALQAAQLAVAAANAAGGVVVDGRRRTVVMVVEDTGNTPEGAIRASLELINQEKVAAIVGSSFSRNAIPSAGVAEEAGIPMICPAATHPQTTAGRPHVFRVSFVDSFQSRTMARFAREQLEATRAAVLYDVTDNYSRGIATVFRQAFEAAGGQVVAFESFTTGERDFTGPLERIRETDPEVLFLPNFSTEVILQGQQARRLGIDAVLLGCDGWLADGLEANPELDGAFFSLAWHRDMVAELPEAQAFIADYRSTYGAEPDSRAAMTYDAFGLLFGAITAASSVDPEAIRQALSRIEGFRGVTGSITLRGTEGDPLRSAVVVQLEDGEIRPFKMIDAEPVR